MKHLLAAKFVQAIFVHKIMVVGSRKECSSMVVFTVGIGKQPLIFQKVTYLVTRRIDQIDPKTWLILGF